MLADTSGSACMSTVLPPHEAASATSREVSRGQIAGSHEKHVRHSFTLFVLFDVCEWT